MRILFIHKNFPAQFGGWARWLTDQGHDITFLTEREDATSSFMRVLRYTPHRAPTPNMHHYLVGTEAAVIASQAVIRVALDLKRTGYAPDIVIAHSGWGGGTFVKDVWPDCAYVPYFEWYYHWPPVDATPHDPQTQDTLDKAMRTHGRNIPFLMDFAAADGVMCPTTFQAAQFPDWMRSGITVSPDGIDSKLHCPGPRSTQLLDNLGIPHDAPVITWITRGMEPARGFPEMMAAMKTLMRDRHDLHAIIIGEDRVAYGAKSDGSSWKDRLLQDFGPDQTRLHFTGLVSRNRMIEVLRTGHVHLYLTAPFVLSWSFLDAMSCGSLIVASDCAPVREFMTDGDNGLLVDMYDPDALVRKMAHALDTQTGLVPLRVAARQTIVDRLDDRTASYPKRLEWLTELAARTRT